MSKKNKLPNGLTAETPIYSLAEFVPMIPAPVTDNDIWCDCTDSSFDNAYYVDDYVDPVIKKHHWNCSKCHKVLQIG